jgi:hypothetical protein
VLEVESTSSQVNRVVLSDAFELAGRASVRLVGDPGWWAACVAAAYVNFGLPVAVQRVVERHELHGRVIVESMALAVEHPDWPKVILPGANTELDLRGEAALRLGPSDADLVEHAMGLDHPLSLPDLRRMFELGVLRWRAGEPRGARRGLESVR